jgi:hypothetical protein
MPESNNQVEAPSGVFKPIADAVEEVCKSVGSKYSNMEVVGNILDTAKRVLQEFFMVESGTLEERVATLLAFKALIHHCPTLPIKKEEREVLERVVDTILGLTKDKELGVLSFEVPREILFSEKKPLVDTAKLKELLARVFLLNAYKPLKIYDLLTWASEGKLFASQDAKSRTYFVTIKIPNLFTDKLDEVVITLKPSVVRSVLAKRQKYDEEGKKKGKSGEDEDAEIFKGVPKVLKNYIVDFLTRGWMPRFPSFEFVELVVRLVTEGGTIYNTPEEEMKAVLTRAFSTFGYVKVTRDPKEKDKRLLEVKILTDLNSLVYVDEGAGEILVPLKLYRSIETKTTTKTAFTKRLVSLGVLKTAHTTNSFWFGEKSHTTLHIAIFDLEKLKQFLDIDPIDLMSPNIPKISFQTIEEITKGDTDVQTVQEG